VTITAQGPLCFSARRPAEQFRESTEYVPGTVLRGAVASLMVEDEQADSAAFQSLFVQERPALFTNAYVAPYVLPVTAMSCKAESGFRPTGHGVKDTLIERLCVEALTPAGLIYIPRCDYCEMRLERYTGFYRRDGQSLRSERVAQRLLTRVAINRRRATAEDELLYSPLVISEGRFDEKRNYHETRFTATIMTQAYTDVLLRYLRQVNRLGSGASRGLGAVQITLEPEPVDDAAELAELRQRRDAFNTAINGFWHTVSQLPGCTPPSHNPDIGTYFSLGLWADAVLKEDGWLPTMVLNERILQERCQVDDDSLLLARAYSGYDLRGGWNVAWGLPKDVDVVVPMGSVFVFWTRHPERWDEALLELERWGVGERTVEGFGQVWVCDAFHIEGQGAIR
jgi:CRISPR-associated protein Csx10